MLSFFVVVVAVVVVVDGTAGFQLLDFVQKCSIKIHHVETIHRGAKVSHRATKTKFKPDLGLTLLENNKLIDVGNISPSN